MQSPAGMLGSRLIVPLDACQLGFEASVCTDTARLCAPHASLLYSSEAVFGGLAMRRFLTTDTARFLDLQVVLLGTTVFIMLYSPSLFYWNFGFH